MRLFRLLARLATRRGTLVGVAIVAILAVLPLALRGSRGPLTLPSRPAARPTVGALRERSRSAAAAAASTAGRVRAALVPAGT